MQEGFISYAPQVDQIHANGNSMASSVERQSFAGGKGAFANFFNELADDCQGSGCDNESGNDQAEEDDARRQYYITAFYGTDDGVPNTNYWANFPTCVQDEKGTDSNVLSLLPTAVHQDNVRVSHTRRKRPKVLEGRYLLGDTIGRGSYGKVKDSIDLQTLRRHAIKIVSKMSVRKIPGGWKHVESEIRLMRPLDHPNVVRLHADLRDTERQRLCMVMEYCLGSIHDLQASGLPDSTQQYRTLPEFQAHRYFVQLIEGVAYLHSLGIVHKDLKPGNLLLTPIDQVKITDFGVSEQLSRYSGTDTIAGGQATPAIQPPEVALGHETCSGFKLDVYGCGVSLYFMLTGQVPFSHPNMLHIFELIAQGNYTIPDSVSDRAADLIRSMMHKEVSSRSTLSSVLSHPWVVESPSCTAADLSSRLHPAVYLASEAARRRQRHLQLHSAQHPVDRGRGHKHHIPTQQPLIVNPLTVLRRLTAHYDWPATESEGDDEQEEEIILGEDMTCTSLNECLMRKVVLNEELQRVSSAPGSGASHNVDPYHHHTVYSVRDCMLQSKVTSGHSGVVGDRGAAATLPPLVPESVSWTSGLSPTTTSVRTVATATGSTLPHSTSTASAAAATSTTLATPPTSVDTGKRRGLLPKSKWKKATSSIASGCRLG